MEHNAANLTSGIEALPTRPSTLTPRYMLVHHVECSGSTPAHSSHPAISTFLDVPRLFYSDNKASALRGRIPDEEAQLRAKQDPDVSFIIHRTYNCLKYHNTVFEALREAPVSSTPPNWSSRLCLLPNNLDNAVAEREYMEIASAHLENAIEAVKEADTKQQFVDESLLLGWKREHNMVAPYLHFYHTRKLLREYVPQLPERQSQHINLLLKYIEEEFGPDYRQAETLFLSDRLVSRKHFDKLFGPREIMVTVQDGDHIAMVSRYPPLSGSNPIRLECEMWIFNGRFAKCKKTVTIPWPKHTAEEDKIPIASLGIFPLRFDQQLECHLRKRGEFFWQLRKPRLVLYTAPSKALDYGMKNGRYVVDIETYRRFQKLNTVENVVTEQIEEYLPLAVTQSASPPNGSFTLLLPPTTYGFGLHDKKWRKLAVEYVADIVWHEDAFDMLDLPQEEKNILRALLSNSKASTDVVACRGQGRVIWLNGGPGVGKTFSAEALAELARKPLYRLTPHEVGIEPSQVENNIKEAFYLGGIWGAVILLDDCDIFFGERREMPLSKISIASIILHEIDNYPGIVILTSEDMVPAYDHALRQRIQIIASLISRMQLATVLRQKKICPLISSEEEKILGTRDLSRKEIENLLQIAEELASHEGEVINFSHIYQAAQVSLIGGTLW